MDKAQHARVWPPKCPFPAEDPGYTEKRLHGIALNNALTPMGETVAYAQLCINQPTTHFAATIQVILC